jgi:hypothetical protein
MTLFTIFRKLDAPTICKDCFKPIEPRPKSEPRLCDDCAEVDRKYDEIMGKEKPEFYKMRRN